MKDYKFDFKTLCIAAQIDTDEYRMKYNELKTARNNTIKQIRENYLPDTPLCRQKLEEAEQNYQTEIAKLKAEYAKGIAEMVDEIRSGELARVQTVNETKLAKLRALVDIPMTAEELLAVAEKYEADNDYWCSRLLANMAESNGIDGFERYTEASYSVKNDILNQIMDQANEVIRDYDGDDTRDRAARQRTKFVLLSKDVLERCQQMWCGEYNSISDEDAVAKAYSTVQLKRTDVEKGLAIANVLKNAKGEKRNLLLCRLAEDTHISEFALRLSGYGTELEAFRAGKAREYRQAKEVVENLGNITDKTNRETLIATNSDNPFLDGLIRSEAKRNTIFRELVGQAYSDADNATVES